MRFLHLELGNWRNFKQVDVPLERRVFLVGPNAAGKSNLLDAFRFLRDLADPQGGGFQRAVQSRGGVSQLRSLHARQYSSIVIRVELDLGDGEPWSYRLEFNQDKQRVPRVHSEVVRHGESVILSRPNRDDTTDQARLTQTHLEQVNANKKFRQVADFLSEVRYLHLVPQLVRDPNRSAGLKQDPFGGDFLEQLARMQKGNKKTFQSRLRRIGDALRVAVPQFKELDLQRDERGVPHLRALYEHWRPNAGWQNETQLSDGTLRLLGLLWVLLENDAPLLLEEPELSLHSAVARHVPSMMYKISRKSGRQVIVSTHSADLLSDSGIGASEVLMLTPTEKGTTAMQASRDAQIRALLSEALPIAEAVLPRTAPRNANQLSLFAD